MMDFDVMKLGELGGTLVALLLLFFVIRELLKANTATSKVVQDNTKAINKLSVTLEKNNLQEEHFRREVIETMNDVHDKVTDIHTKVVQ